MKRIENDCSSARVNPYPVPMFIYFFIHLKLCLTNATQNFKWLKISHICLICSQIFANVDV